MRDVADFMTPEERALPPEEGIARYNARLAQIYLGEQAIGDVPINMDGFALFAPDGRSLLIRGVVDVETLMQAVVSVAACRVGGNLVCEVL